MAYAVKELFPEAQVTIGPVIENGFYYDFAYKRPFTPEDLAAIEKRMAELAKKDFPGHARGLGRATRRWSSSSPSASTTRRN
jgi:threonyl-tRNA synthetase